MTWAIILAAGSGSRLRAAGIQTSKQFLSWKDRPLFWHSVRTMSRNAAIHGFVFVFPPEELEQGTKLVAELTKRDEPGALYKVVAGGKRRQDSVFNGLQALPRECDRVLVHDSARPFVSPALVASLLARMDEGATAVIPALEVKDTIKQVDGDTVDTTLDRAVLRAVQTPQAFDKQILQDAHNHALANGWEVTDDASMVEQNGGVVHIVPGEATNAKITTQEDLTMLQEQTTAPLPCVGWGYDVHRYVDEQDPKARPMILGGIPIPKAPFVAAHSDGDVLLHAVADALLGLLCKGDIGQLFPDSDPKLDNVSSSVLVNEVLLQIHQAEIVLTHVDLTIVAQKPRLAPYAEAIRKNTARVLRVPPEMVNFKATTEEKLGFTGAKKGMKAVAAITGLKPALRVK